MLITDLSRNGQIIAKRTLSKSSISKNNIKQKLSTKLFDCKTSLKKWLHISYSQIWNIATIVLEDRRTVNAELCTTVSLPEVIDE